MAWPPLPFRRRLAGALVALGAVLGGPAGANELEYAVKAAYLPKLMSYVTWPRPTGALTICVAGTDPFGPLLEQAADGQSIDGRPVLTRRLAPGAPAGDCSLVYVGDGGSTAAGMLKATAPMLVVTDASRGAPARGDVHFVVRDKRVRFHIDQAAAARKGLAISSKLLSLALSVKTRG